MDRGALDACLEKHFDSGGWCPKGKLAEDGKIDDKYPLRETKDCNYDTRTRLNVKDSDGTLIISHENLTGGTLLTWQICKELNKPVLVIKPEFKNYIVDIENFMDWINDQNICILNVAGPRKSEWNDGYRMSYLLIKDLIEKLQKST